jgi:predicted TIM-barrel fold metal-dependent hydrolase
MIVDSHTHIFPPRLREQRDSYLRRDPGFAELYASPRAKLASAEDLIASMDAAGVQASVAMNFGWGDQSLCQETNDYILDAAARFPGRIVPFVAVQPLAGEAALREVERCARAGARGVGEMRPYAQGFELADDCLAPVLAQAKVLQLPVALHCSEPVGHQYPGKGTTTPDRLYPFLQRYSDQTLILAHWGGGLAFYALMPEVRAALKNTYVDSAASHLLYDGAVFKVACELLGAEHLLWGSDYPLLSQAKDLVRVRAALAPETADAVLGGNAARLLGLDSHD